MRSMVVGASLLARPLAGSIQPAAAPSTPFGGPPLRFGEE